MTDVNVDLVHGEHATDLFEDGRARSLNAVSAEECIDVVGIDAVVVDNTLVVAPRELPQPRNI